MALEWNGATAGVPLFPSEVRKISIPQYIEWKSKGMIEDRGNGEIRVTDALFDILWKNGIVTTSR